MLHGIKNMNKFELNRIEMKLIYLYVLHLIKHIYRFYRIRRLFSFPTSIGQLKDRNRIFIKHQFTAIDFDIQIDQLLEHETISQIKLNDELFLKYHYDGKISNTQLLIYCIYNLDRAYCLQLLIIKKVSIRKRLEFKPQFQICQMITRKDEIHELHFVLSSNER